MSATTRNVVIAGGLVAVALAFWYFSKKASAAAIASQTSPPVSAINTPQGTVTQQGTTTKFVSTSGQVEIFDLPQGQPITVPGPR